MQQDKVVDREENNRTTKRLSMAFKNLTLTHFGHTIFRNLNAEVMPGEFIGVFGPNAAGKSTLLKAILGLIRPTQGELLVFGKKATRGHLNIGYLPQAKPNEVNSQLSGRTHLAVSLQGFKWGLPRLKDKHRDEIAWAIDQVEATHFVDRPFSQLSGGERQRLLLAQALLGRPSLLLLDEPLLHLDPHYQGRLIELVQYVRSEFKTTVLLTSHDINPLLGVMDRALYLANSRAAMGSIEEIISSQKLSELYGTDIEVMRHKERLFVTAKSPFKISTMLP